MLGLAVAVVVLLVRGPVATRIANRVSSAATRSVPECAASATRPSEPETDARDELHRDEERRSEDADQRGALSHARKLAL